MKAYRYPLLRIAGLFYAPPPPHAISGTRQRYGYNLLLLCHLIADPLGGAGQVAVAGLAVGILVGAVGTVVTGSTLHIGLAVALARLLAAGHVA